MAIRPKKKIAIKPDISTCLLVVVVESLMSPVGGVKNKPIKYVSEKYKTDTKLNEREIPCT